MGNVGFSIKCGCNCLRCGGHVRLEGYSDADGVHYCPRCDDYVDAGSSCLEMTPEKVLQRQEIIAAADALADKLEGK